jgi:flagellar motor switch/type III secretory pathway protein FliN
VTVAFDHWLPANAAAPRLAQAAAADAVEAWSREWFADAGLRTSGTFARIADPRAELRKTSWHDCEGGLAIGVPEAGIAALGAAVLGIASGSRERPAADVELLDRVGGECLEDLKRRAAALLGLARGAVWTVAEAAGRGGAVHRLDIADPGRGVVLTLELGACQFARFAKAKLPPPRPAGPLGRPEDALAALPVRVAAALGPCSITVAELARLVPGDVLVLGRAVAAPLPFALGGRPARRGTCTVVEAADGIALKVTQAPIG